MSLSKILWLNYASGNKIITFKWKIASKTVGYMCVFVRFFVIYPVDTAIFSRLLIALCTTEGKCNNYVESNLDYAETF